MNGTFLDTTKKELRRNNTGTVYDALNLCYQAIKSKDPDEYEKGVKWYKDMVDITQKIMQLSWAMPTLSATALSSMKL